MKLKHTFIIHDYETFGQDPALDFPAQFAGIRTDMNFNIIEDPIIIYCRPSNDYLPQPAAVMVTGITPQFTLSCGINESDFAKQIHQMFSVPGTCVMGYNNISFDDEVTRNIFYRNFYDPYSYSWENGNSRWDLIDVMRTCYSLRPEGINWPKNEHGLPSFKLEYLSKFNGIKHNNAHDAMSDVYATIALAKLVKEAQPKLFNYLFQLRNKYKISELLRISTKKPLVHISGIFGAYRGNISLVTQLARHPINKNAVIMCDLTGDISLLLDLDIYHLRKLFYTKHHDLQSDQLPIPLKLVYINKCPVLAPVQTLRPEDALRFDLDIQRCIYNLKILHTHPELQEKVVAIFADSKPFNLSDNVYAQLYDGFFNDNDKCAMKIIRESLPHNLLWSSLKFQDKRMLPLLFRYRARNFPETLTDDEKRCWQLHRRTVLNYERLQSYYLQLQELYDLYKEDTKKIINIKLLFDYMQNLIN
ncbi:exodeoxyribonuclease I [Candidatus Profftia sp. (ex Adelges kitamiensis)]|uniref:exodeoxyribonuclease I n=1 Tax=Candidatus Profftia sp. (ex Adelges kitamiensis) TaxID=2864218 RepID=UPI001CE3A9FC|nr:exodeoxyribonuclease I [Candidatus Profftia sp. (ex Adelges kitamiensis)]